MSSPAALRLANRRTKAKFYRVQNGRTEQRKRKAQEAKVIKTPREDWVVIPGAVPAIVTTEDWEKAQILVKSRRRARGGAGHCNRRWLLTGVLVCGDCGHKFWGDPRRKGRIEGRAPVITNYCSCAGRRSCGKLICSTASTLRAEQLESWVLGILQGLVQMDAEATDDAIERFVESVAQESPRPGDENRILREIKQVIDLVTALTMNIDAANLMLLNDRLTQLRLCKARLEQELRAARQSSSSQDSGALRKWARDQLAGLHDAMAGTRNDQTRDMIATYVDRITVWPSRKRGEVVLNAGAGPLWKCNDRRERRSWVNKIGVTVRQLNFLSRESAPGRQKRGSCWP